MEACVFCLVLFVGVPAVIAAVIDGAEKAAKDKAAAAAKAADEKFLMDHPEAWLARQRAGLEREALEAGKRHAEEESNRRNASTLSSILRGWF